MKLIQYTNDIQIGTKIGLLNRNCTNSHQSSLYNNIHLSNLIKHSGKVIEITYRGTNINNAPYVGGFLRVTLGKSVPQSGGVNSLKSFIYTEGDGHIVLLDEYD